jgi:quercetin dioxygenase-like cupin family protein
MAAAVTIKRDEELERDYEIWVLVRRSLGVESFGLNMVELPPGKAIPEHDETERDQEEVFYVVDGAVTLVADGEDHAAPAGTWARFDPAVRRTVRNDGDTPAKVLIVSAPRGSGYESMGWA